MPTKKVLQSILEEIREFCRNHADEKQSTRYARFFTEGYDAYGVDAKLIVEQKDVWIEKYRDTLGLNGALKLGELLLESGKYEEASFAILLLEPYRRQVNSDTFQQIGDWLERGVRNWAHTDVLCSVVLEPLLTDSVVPLSELKSWRESPSKWRRRAVPVAMLGLGKQHKKIEPLLQFIEPLMTDEDRFVQQGLGWFLREAWKKQPKPVESFLHQWKETAPRKIFQYATEKMTPALKEKFRRRKKTR